MHSQAFYCCRLFFLVCLLFLMGCVERRFVISTDPPGAIVYDEMNRPVSASPADKPFTYYGKYRFTLVRDGYETMVVEEDVKTPWYEYPFLDFISENLVPWNIRDIRRLHYQMTPLQPVSPEQLLNDANNARARGLSIGPPVALPGEQQPQAPATLMPPAVP